MAIPNVEGLPPALAYARLLWENHRLISIGQGDSKEAEDLADVMDGPWYAMTQKEEARLSGLSVDLYSLAEGGPKQVEMRPEEAASWQERFHGALSRFDAGDADALLDFLREPSPSSVPGHAVRFLQARCWESLGDLPTALAFLRDAERKNAAYAGPVLALLQRMGERDAAARQAERLLTLPLPARTAG